MSNTEQPQNIDENLAIHTHTESVNTDARQHARHYTRQLPPGIRNMSYAELLERDLPSDVRRMLDALAVSTR